jgi:hypothetical protein
MQIRGFVGQGLPGLSKISFSSSFGCRGHTYPWRPGLQQKSIQDPAPQTHHVYPNCVNCQLFCCAFRSAVEMRWPVLQGDAVSLDKDNTCDSNGDSSKSSLLPNLTHRAVRAYFHQPRIAIGKFCFSHGPTSSVVIGSPYVDDHIQIGKGGTDKYFLFAYLKMDTKTTGKWK